MTDGEAKIIMYDRLRRAVVDYLSEVDNPVPDALYRNVLRNRLRELVGVERPQEVQRR